MRKQTRKLNVQNAIVSICFLVVCLASQQIQTKAWNSGLIEFSRDVTGVLMAIVIITNYHWSHFVKYKIPYMVWTFVGGLSFVIGVPIAIEHRYDYLFADTIVIAMGIFLMGYCIIHTAIIFFVEKYRPRLYKPLIILWSVLLLWMIFSETEYWWPEAYFVLFICYYLTEQTSEQRKNILEGVVNGIILGFLVIQGHSFLCRPYDRAYYYGNFCNANHNSMFLSMCLAAILSKILMRVRDRKKNLLQAFYYLMAAVCYAFIFMTGCRSGYLAAFVVTIGFLLGYCRLKRKMGFFRMGILLVSLFITMLPVTYLAVRYIPTIHPHVVFYFQEGYSEKRVHSWDPRNSEKYVSFEEMLQAIIRKFTNFVESADKIEDIVKVEGYCDLYIVSNADYIPNMFLTAMFPDFIKHKDPDRIPIIEIDGGEHRNQAIVRYTIYKWYFDHLSLRGMPYDEQGFQLTATHWIQDTHNIYLDYGINFGWPAMIMFTVFIWWGIGRLTLRGMKMRDPETLACLLICLVPPIFGLFEYSWGPGMISTVAFYLAFKEMFNMENVGTAQCSAAPVPEIPEPSLTPAAPVDDLEFLNL